MPHENSGGGGGGGGGGGEDLASTDEVKVYKDEGDEEKRASENLSEDKLGLVIETEEGKNSDIEDRHFLQDRKSSDGQSRGSHTLAHPLAGRLPFGYPFIPPYPYTGAASLGLGAVPVPPTGFPFYVYGNDLFSQPPPAHMGLTHWPLGGSHSSGLPSAPSLYGLPSTQTPPLYGIHPSQTPPLYGITHPHRQFTHPFYSSEFPPVPWASTSGYAMPFPSPYSPYQLSRFSPGGMLPPHPNIPCAGVSHPTLVATCQTQEPAPPTTSTSSYTVKQRHLGFLGCGTSEREVSSGEHRGSNATSVKSSAASKISHIKKPLNAFMLFMKEMRQKVIDECTLKESAAINQILGRKWHSLDRSEQAKYYEMAKKEKELHRRLYPTWSARDNYALHAKKKRKRDNSHHDDDKGTDAEEDRECPNAKKCRARFGLDQQNQWCKPCRRKKRCIRFLQENDETGIGDEEDHDDDMMPGTIPAADSTTELFSPMPSSISSNSDEPRGRLHAVGDETFPGSLSSVGPGSCLSCDDGVPLHRMPHLSQDPLHLSDISLKLSHPSSASSSGLSSASAISGLITSTIR